MDHYFGHLASSHHHTVHDPDWQTDQHG